MLCIDCAIDILIKRLDTQRWQSGRGAGSTVSPWAIASCRATELSGCAPLPRGFSGDAGGITSFLSLPPSGRFSSPPALTLQNEDLMASARVLAVMKACREDYWPDVFAIASSRRQQSIGEWAMHPEGVDEGTRLGGTGLIWALWGRRPGES